MLRASRRTPSVTSDAIAAALAPGLAICTTLLCLGALALGCGGPQYEEIIPRLPVDGTAHTAKPPAMPPVADEPPSDPWEDREDLIAAPAPKPPRALDLPKIERFSLNNGLSVVVVANERLPVVDMRLAIKAGSQDSPRDKMGVERFVAAMLTKGTRTRNALQVAEYADRAGANLGAEATLEATFVNCSALVDSLRRCATILADVVVNPTFPKGEIDLVRKQLLAVVQQRKDNAGAMAGAHLHNLLWGDEHVRGWPMSARTLEAIERTDLRKWHLRHFTPKNAVLVVSGAVDPAKIKTEMQRAFRWWQKRNPPKRASHQTPTMTGSRVRLVDKPGQTQAHIRIAQFGIAHGDPRYYDHQVFNYVLGGGAFSSRLMKVVRSEAGNTYSVSSNFERTRDRGAFIVSTFTRSDATLATINLLLREMDKMKKQGPENSEVASAIAYLSGNYLTRFESAAAVGRALLAAELHGQGQEYVRDYPLAVAKVSRESAAKAASTALDLQKMAIVLVGDAKVIEPQLKKVGWKYEKVDYRSPVASYERQSTVAGADDPASQAKARKLIERAVAAKGGVAKLRAIKTMTVEATGQIAAQGRNMPATFTRRFVTPDRLRMDIDFNFGGGTASVITVLNRDKAWNQNPGQSATALPPEAVVEFRKQLWRDHEFVLLHALEAGAKLKLLPEKTEGGRTFDVVSVTRPDGLVSVVVELDRKTRMLSQLSYSDQGVAASEAFADYRSVRGIKVAHKRVTQGADASLQVNVTKVRFDDSIKDTMFSMPK